jgi:hypothetical protein
MYHIYREYTSGIYKQEGKNINGTVYDAVEGGKRAAAAMTMRARTAGRQGKR